MRRIALLFLLVAAATARADEPPPPVAPPLPPRVAAKDRPVAPMESVDAARLRAHVADLASPARRGRGTDPDRRQTARDVAAWLAAVGVGPVPGTKADPAAPGAALLQPFPSKDGDPAGVNVVGWIEGTRTDEHVVISAHFDHLQPKRAPLGTDEVWFPGADDNASGVAALVEVAASLAGGANRPARSIVVVAFDLEETNCVGSKRYCEEPAVPLAQCAAFTTMDMMGRSMADIYPGLLLVMGAERSDALLGLTATLPAAKGVVLRELGMDFNQLGWSDYVPFEARRVPSLFFTSGACRDYHRPTDTADRLDVPALAARAATVVAAVRALAALPARPAWKEKAEPRLGEIESLHALVQEAGAKEDELQVPAPMRAMRKTFEENLAKTLAKGTVTVGERAAIRNLALMMFQAASQAR